MLIHESTVVASESSERRWMEIWTFGIVALVIGLSCFVAVREIESVERSAAVDVAMPPAPATAAVNRAEIEIDPNWEPSDEIVFRARYEHINRCVAREGKHTWESFHVLDVKDVTKGRLGIKMAYLHGSWAPKGVEDFKTYTFRWKPNAWSKSEIKSARKNGRNVVWWNYWDH